MGLHSPAHDIHNHPQPTSRLLHHFMNHIAPSISQHYFPFQITMQFPAPGHHVAPCAVGWTAAPPGGAASLAAAAVCGGGRAAERGCAGGEDGTTGGRAMLWRLRFREFWWYVELKTIHDTNYYIFYIYIYIYIYYCRCLWLSMGRMLQAKALVLDQFFRESLQDWGASLLPSLFCIRLWLWLTL